MRTGNTRIFNTDQVSGSDRSIAGAQPDHSSPSSSGSPGGTGTSMAPLPTYTSGGTSPYKIVLNKPPGATGSYNFSYRNPSGSGAFGTIWNFPVTLTMAGASTTFDGYASDSDKTPSYLDIESWNSLFL